MDRKKYFIITYDITSKSMHAANEIGERRKCHMIHLLHVICWNLRKTEQTLCRAKRYSRVSMNLR